MKFHQLSGMAAKNLQLEDRMAFSDPEGDPGDFSYNNYRL